MNNSQCKKRPNRNLEKGQTRPYVLPIINQLPKNVESIKTGETKIKVNRLDEKTNNLHCKTCFNYVNEYKGCNKSRKCDKCFCSNALRQHLITCPECPSKVCTSCYTFAIPLNLYLTPKCAKHKYCENCITNGLKFPGKRICYDCSSYFVTLNTAVCIEGISCNLCGFTPDSPLKCINHKYCTKCSEFLKNSDFSKFPNVIKCKLCVEAINLLNDRKLNEEYKSSIYNGKNTRRFHKVNNSISGDNFLRNELTNSPLKNTEKMIDMKKLDPEKDETSLLAKDLKLNESINKNNFEQNLLYHHKKNALSEVVENYEEDEVEVVKPGLPKGANASEIFEINTLLKQKASKTEIFGIGIISKFLYASISKPNHPRENLESKVLISKAVKIEENMSKAEKFGFGFVSNLLYNMKSKPNDFSRQEKLDKNNTEFNESAAMEMKKLEIYSDKKVTELGTIQPEKNSKVSDGYLIDLRNPLKRNVEIDYHSSEIELPVINFSARNKLCWNKMQPIETKNPENSNFGESHMKSGYEHSEQNEIASRINLKNPGPKSISEIDNWKQQNHNKQSHDKQLMTPDCHQIVCHQCGNIDECIKILCNHMYCWECLIKNCTNAIKMIYAEYLTDKKFKFQKFTYKCKVENCNKSFMIPIKLIEVNLKKLVLSDPVKYVDLCLEYEFFESKKIEKWLLYLEGFKSTLD